MKIASYWSNGGVFLATVIYFGAFSSAFASDVTKWGKASDVFANGLGLAAVALTLSENDQEGMHQGVKVAGATFLVVEGLKRLSQKERPDHSDKRSFPSGHTALAFAAAGFIDRRYGHKKPIVAALGYGMAVMTGLGRVKARKHFSTDVLAGAVIGLVAARHFTSANNSGINISISDQSRLKLSYEKKF